MGSTPTWGTPSPLLFFFPAEPARAGAGHVTPPAPWAQTPQKCRPAFRTFQGHLLPKPGTFPSFFFFVRGGERVASSRYRSARGRSAPQASERPGRRPGGACLDRGPRGSLLRCSGPGSPRRGLLGAPAAPRRGASRRGGRQGAAPPPRASPRAPDGLPRRRGERQAPPSPGSAGSGRRRERWPWATGTQVSRRPREPRGAAAPAAAWARAAAAAGSRRAEPTGERAPAPAGARPNQTMPKGPNDA